MFYTFTDCKISWCFKHFISSW